jgi:hypothetical protein
MGLVRDIQPADGPARRPEGYEDGLGGEVAFVGFQSFDGANVVPYVDYWAEKGE